MIRSMTSYGRASGTFENLQITLEIKSVNHRYFEMNFRLPRGYAFLEDKLKGMCQEQVNRGKVECFLQIEKADGTDVEVQVNHALASEYYKGLQELKKQYKLKNDISVSSLARYPDVLMVTKAQTEEETIWNAVKQAMKQALEAMIAMRETEGAKMREDVLCRTASIERHVAFVEERSPQTVKEYHKKLMSRMQELLSDTHIEEQRIITEAAIFADKVAVDEETVRMRSHISQLCTLLEENEPIGRKLDFLIQEMNREANTIGSKSQDVALTKTVVEMKSEIEKIREQIQNIE